MANSRPLHLNNDDAIIPIPRKKRNKRNNAALQPVIQSATTAAKLQASINAYLAKFRQALGQSITIPMPLQAGQTGHRVFSMLNSKDLNAYAATSRQAYIDVREWQRQNQHTLFAAPLQRIIESAQSNVTMKSKKASSLSQLTGQAFRNINQSEFILLLGATFIILMVSFIVLIKYANILDIFPPLATIGITVGLAAAIIIGGPLLFRRICAPALSKHFTEVKSDYDTTAEVLNALAATLNDTPISEVLQQINQHFGEHDAPEEEEDDLIKMEAGLRLSDESSPHEADVADEETPLLLRRQ